MKAQQIPKYLFLNQDNEEISDRRICPVVSYDTSGDTPVKIKAKKINNSISFAKPVLNQNNNINSIVYSNRFGLMMLSCQNKILVTDHQNLETIVFNVGGQKEDPIDFEQYSLEIKLNEQQQGASTKLYMSPDEQHVIILTKRKIILYDLKSFSKVSQTQNTEKFRFLMFVNAQSMVCWNFLQKCYIFPKLLQDISQRQVVHQDIQMCTSVNVINKHVIVSQKLKDEEKQDLKISVFDETCTKKKNEITGFANKNPSNYLLQYCHILSIFPITPPSNSAEYFHKDDVYGLVLGYWDDQEYQPDKRYLNFMKGNLLEQMENLDIRGQELFLSPSDHRSLYYDSETQEKLTFEVQTLQIGKVVVILIEKTEVIFAVDTTLQFQDLCLYPMNGLHQIKQPSSKYFKGVCVMKNMFPRQRVPPTSNSNDICNNICQKFNGEWLSLYFASKQTEITMQFPQSLIILGDQMISRKYAIQTAGGIEEYKLEEIMPAIEKAGGKSTLIQPIKEALKVNVDAENKGEKNIGQDKSGDKSKKQQATKNQKLTLQQVQSKPTTAVNNAAKKESEKTIPSSEPIPTSATDNKIAKKEEEGPFLQPQQPKMFQQPSSLLQFLKKDDKKQSSSSSSIPTTSISGPSPNFTLQSLFGSKGKDPAPLPSPSLFGFNPKSKDNNTEASKAGGMFGQAKPDQDTSPFAKKPAVDSSSKKVNIFEGGNKDKVEANVQKSSLKGASSAFSSIFSTQKANPNANANSMLSQNSPSMFSNKPSDLFAQKRQVDDKNALASKSIFGTNKSTVDGTKEVVSKDKMDKNSIFKPAQPLTASTNQIPLFKSPKQILIQKLAKLLNQKVQKMSPVMRTLSDQQLQELIKSLNNGVLEVGVKEQKAQTQPQQKQQQKPLTNSNKHQESKIIATPTPTATATQSAIDNLVLSKTKDFKNVIRMYENLNLFINDWKGVQSNGKYSRNNSKSMFFIFSISNTQKMLSQLDKSFPYLSSLSSLSSLSQRQKLSMQQLNPVVKLVQSYSHKMQFLEQQYKHIFMSQKYRSLAGGHQDYHSQQSSSLQSDEEAERLAAGQKKSFNFNNKNTATPKKKHGLLSHSKTNDFQCSQLIKHVESRINLLLYFKNLICKGPGQRLMQSSLKIKNYKSKDVSDTHQNKTHTINPTDKEDKLIQRKFQSFLPYKTLFNHQNNQNSSHNNQSSSQNNQRQQSIVDPIQILFKVVDKKTNNLAELTQQANIKIKEIDKLILSNKRSNLHNKNLKSTFNQQNQKSSVLSSSRVSNNSCTSSELRKGGSSFKFSLENISSSSSTSSQESQESQQNIGQYSSASYKQSQQYSRSKKDYVIENDRFFSSKYGSNYNNTNDQQYDQQADTRTFILNRFKPKIVDFNKIIGKSSLYTFGNDQSDNNPEQYDDAINPEFLRVPAQFRQGRWAPSSSLSNSNTQQQPMRKSLDFKQRVPLKKDDQKHQKQKYDSRGNAKKTKLYDKGQKIYSSNSNSADSDNDKYANRSRRIRYSSQIDEGQSDDLVQFDKGADRGNLGHPIVGGNTHNSDNRNNNDNDDNSDDQELSISQSLNRNVSISQPKPANITTGKTGDLTAEKTASNVQIKQTTQKYVPQRKIFSDSGDTKVDGVNTKQQQNKQNTTRLFGSGSGTTGASTGVFGASTGIFGAGISSKRTGLFGKAIETGDDENSTLFPSSKKNASDNSSLTQSDAKRVKKENSNQAKEGAVIKQKKQQQKSKEGQEKVQEKPKLTTNTDGLFGTNTRSVFDGVRPTASSDESTAKDKSDQKKVESGPTFSPSIFGAPKSSGLFSNLNQNKLGSDNNGGDSAQAKDKKYSDSQVKNTDEKKAQLSWLNNHQGKEKPQAQDKNSIPNATSTGVRMFGTDGTENKNGNTSNDKSSVFAKENPQPNLNVFSNWGKGSGTGTASESTRNPSPAFSTGFIPNQPSVGFGSQNNRFMQPAGGSGTSATVHGNNSGSGAGTNLHGANSSFSSSFNPNQNTFNPNRGSFGFGAPITPSVSGVEKSSSSNPGQPVATGIKSFSNVSGGGLFGGGNIEADSGSSQFRSQSSSAFNAFSGQNNNTNNANNNSTSNNSNGMGSGWLSPQNFNNSNNNSNNNNNNNNNMNNNLNNNLFKNNSNNNNNNNNSGMFGQMNNNSNNNNNGMFGQMNNNSNNFAAGGFSFNNNNNNQPSSGTNSFMPSTSSLSPGLPPPGGSNALMKPRK